MISQQDLALQMIAQLRVLDPSASAEIGTPERKILDTFAQALYDSQIDISALNNSLNLDDKFGTQLDRFLAIFGFGRRKATYASGFVTFSRTTPSTLDIRIPAGTTIQAPAENIGGTNEIVSNVQFSTTYDVILAAGDTSVYAPVRCNVAGSVGNVSANKITEFIGTTTYGITAVTNETKISNGADLESDTEFKLRFRNTVFRNLAGTQDQYMALAISTAFTSKANVVGPISLYKEYIQVPAVDDASAYDVDYPVGVDTETGGGSSGEYTTALSTIPYAKDIWNQNPVFVSSNSDDITSIFYREGVDYDFNWSSSGAPNVGDTLRFNTASPAVLDSRVPGSLGIPGVLAEPSNVTFTNVYTGADAAVAAIRPNDVVLLEYQYLSSASRNNKALNITNAVDVFIDGGNDTLASTVIPRPTTSTAFSNTSSSKYYYENYRRVGDSSRRPVIGNVFTPLFWQPVTDVPDTIVVGGTTTYYKGVHYWAVEDVSNLGGSVRSRCGIEWSVNTNGVLSTDDPDASPGTYTGAVITNVTSESIEVNDYVYDKNIIDLQSALEGSKQITTDVLARKAKRRYFKLNLAIMYTPGVSIANVNAQISLAVDRFLKSLYFGSAIQLSDLLQVVHGVSGVDNVRWVPDSPATSIAVAQPNQTRVIETDIDGNPLLNVRSERTSPGTSGSHEFQALYLTGNPISGTFKLVWRHAESSDLNYDATAGQIQTELRAIIGENVVVTEDTRPTDGVITPIRSFVVEWPSNGDQEINIESIPSLAGGDYAIANDFFLKDDELAALSAGVLSTDSAAGIIAEPRAQNTWVRTN
jgi:uncharacterized phage protein gp47/JayE